MKPIYWHIQMYLPSGRDGDAIDSVKMLQEPVPIIGTGEWNDFQCHNFKNTNKQGLQIGDIILVREGRKPLALCKVTSESFTNPIFESKYINRHYRYVQILSWYNDTKAFPQPQGTLQKLSNSKTESWAFINNWYKQILDKMETNIIVKILKQKKQIILQGAPGAGKTYATASIALSLLGVDYDPNNHSDIMQKYKAKCNDKRVFFTTFHQSMDYEDFVEGLKPKAENGGIIYREENGIFKQICEYATNIANVDITTCIDNYLQLIKTYKNKRVIPTKSGKSYINIWWNEGNDTISVRSTVSKAQGTEETSQSPLNIEKVKLQAIGEGIEPNWSSYADAFIQAVMKEYKIGEQTSETPYLLIIDEINRGNVSKIFGELITLLESDKRKDGDHPITVTLPYSKTEFSIPSNLYIIGTMNTTDRSVGHIDYAVRRRFAFYTLKANTDAINSYYDNNKHDNGTREIALKLFEDIKAFVTKHKSDDFNIEDLMVGHSYFMAETKEELTMKLEYEIIPLIREYEKDGIISLNNEERIKLGEEWMSLIV